MNKNYFSSEVRHAVVLSHNYYVNTVNTIKHMSFNTTPLEF